MNSDDNEELFDGAVELQRHERGLSFGLDPMTYYRLACCCNTAGSMGVEPAVICKLPDSERGVKVVLFGRTHAFSVIVRVSRSCARIDVSAEPLDGPLHCRIPLYEGQDCDAHWSRALRAMLAVEGTRYVDQFWAQEQSEQGDGDGFETA